MQNQTAKEYTHYVGFFVNNQAPIVYQADKIQFRDYASRVDKLSFLERWVSDRSTTTSWNSNGKMIEGGSKADWDGNNNNSFLNNVQTFPCI